MAAKLPHPAQPTMPSPHAAERKQIVEHGRAARDRLHREHLARMFFGSEPGTLTGDQNGGGQS